MTNLLSCSIQNRIGFVKLDSLSNRNALSVQLIEELIAQLKAFDKDKTVKAIIIHTDGPVFSSGGELSAIANGLPLEEALDWMKSASKLPKTILNMEKFVIGAVNGYAAGAGFSLALACDFIIASEDAKFVCSFSKVGVIPDLGLIKLLADRVPINIVKQWIVTAKEISIHEALERGIVNEVAGENLLEEAIIFANLIVEGSSDANKFVKYLVNNAQSVSHDVSIMQENLIQSILFQSSNSKEGINAFFEKRKPRFS